MSRRYKGGVISATAPVPTGPFQCGTAKGIWTLPQQMQARAANIWPIAGNVVPGSQTYAGKGTTFTWVAPAGVNSVSVVVVGVAGTCGAALSYKNNISVTPGSSYNVGLQTGGGGQPDSSYFLNTCTVRASGRTGRTGDGGGNGGIGADGGGGAGGYAGNGGNGLQCCTQPTNGAGGGGSGGGANFGGGGVGLLGQGASGTYAGSVGIGGSGGANASSGIGGNYGGGGGGTGTNNACGAVRIVWPGTTRTFPSTCVGNP